MRALYTAATGLAAQQARIDNIANNLSNVSTTGYKRARESFEDLVYQEIATGAADPERQRPAGVHLGAGTRLVANERDFSPGAPQQTGEPLDVAILGRGFLVVEDANGNERYTRDGALTTNSDGEIVNSAGLPLSGSIRVPDDADQLIIGEDGTVSATFLGEEEPVVIGALQLVDFVNPGGLKPMGGNLYAATVQSGEGRTMDPGDGKVRLQQGALESSNVDVADELVEMIMAQRSFELTSKVIEAADETLKQVSQLKR